MVSANIVHNDNTRTACKALVYSRDLSSLSNLRPINPAQEDETGIVKDSYTGFCDTKPGDDDLLEIVYDGELSVFPLLKEATPADDAFYLLELGKRRVHAA